MTTVTGSTAPRSHDAAAGVALPARLPVGRRDGVVPDRGRGRRGRPRPLHLGHLLASPRRDRRTPTPATSRATTTAGCPRTSRSCSELGLTSYRFSVAWPRVRPDGGPVEPRGLAFYDRLVDELLAHDVAPWLTLYHWDLPQALEDAGGWTDRDTAYRFADYAVSVYDALGDRVPVWTTLNEPWCSAFLGYSAGVHAPGRREGAAGLVAAHHLLLGHGLVLDALRGRGDAQWGISLNFTVADAGVRRPRRRRRRAADRRPAQPVVPRPALPRGATPPTCSRTPSTSAGSTSSHDGDLALISAPIDVLGVNYYHGDAVSGRPERGADRPPRRPANGAGVGVPVGRARDVPAAWTAADGDGLGGAARGPAAACSSGCATTTPCRRSTSPRPARRTSTSWSTAPCTTRSGSRSWRPTSAAVQRRDRRRRRRARGLLVVAPRQLRVGLRLRQAVRPRARRLRDPGAHPEVQRPYCAASRTPRARAPRGRDH